MNISLMKKSVKGLLSLPITVMQHETIDGQDVIVSRPFKDSMEAFKYIFDTQMEPEDAQKAYKILSDYYTHGQVIK